MTMPTNPVSEAVTIIKVTILVAVIAVIGYMGYRIKSLEADNAQQAIEIVEYKSANDDWKSKTDTANAAIKQFQDEADAAEKAVAVALKQAASVQQIQIISAKRIEALTPQGDDCTATKKLTDIYFGKKRP